MVNLYNIASALMVIIIVVLHRILTALNICEGFSERSAYRYGSHTPLSSPIHTAAVPVSTAFSERS